MERLRGNLGRLGYTAEVVLGDAAVWRPETPADGILLDAPCSATGTFRRHPEVLVRAGGTLAKLLEQQRRMLAHAVEGLRPGGTLIYCVCSLEPEEGEAQMLWAQQTLPVDLDPIRPEELAGLEGAVTPEGTVRTTPAMVVPGEAGGTLDGFFIARLHRRF